VIYTHSVGRALQYFPQHTALLRDGHAVTFLKLDDKVRRIAAALRRRGLRSGDRLAFLMPNGVDYIELVYFYIVDRAKEMIVSGGENVYAGEVEAAIYEISEVQEAAVFGIPDEKWGELVAAVVVLRPGTKLSAEELQQYCRARIASYKVPRHIELMTVELPKSGSGKILKRVLREKYWVGQSRRV
jgi:acyl-CoA synthetase (AMP-forming)/AMP-acid ligase II